MTMVALIKSQLSTKYLLYIGDMFFIFMELLKHLGYVLPVKDLHDKFNFVNYGIYAYKI